jgi:hypothetical protein
VLVCILGIAVYVPLVFLAVVIAISAAIHHFVARNSKNASDSKAGCLIFGLTLVIAVIAVVAATMYAPYALTWVFFGAIVLLMIVGLFGMMS